MGTRTGGDDDARPMRDPEAALEQELINEFLESHGHNPSTLHDLPEAERRHLLEQASAFATGRLAEIGARAHYVDDLRRRE